MKKLFTGIILSIVAAAAFALPRPAQIEDELANRDYQSARVHVQQVLDEKPNSAKAHLFNAYILLKADNNAAAANEELRTARRLDKNGDVKNSALFGRTVALLENAPAARPQPVQRRQVVQDYQPAPVVYQAPVAAPVKSGGIGFWGWVLILGVIGFIAWLILRNREPKVIVRSERTSYGTYPDAPTRRRTVAVAEPETTYVPPAPTLIHNHEVYVAPTRSVPSSFIAAPTPAPSTTIINNGSNGGGSGNGLLTGMMLNEMMHSHGHSHSSGYSRDDFGSTERVERRPAPVYEEPAYVAPSRTSYEDSRSSYSSGSSDSWSSSSSSSSSDSSSSWDSGSSSSDSGGSWD